MIQTLKKTFTKIDPFFFWVVVSLVLFGVLMFISASLGVLAKDTQKFSGILVNQLVLGLGVGSVLFCAGLLIPYTFWQRYAFYILAGAVVLTLLVHIPGLGMRHGGATRWISIGPIAFQPAEVLKVAFVLYFATWVAWVKNGWDQIRSRAIPCAVLVVGAVGSLLSQPDTKSLILMAVSAIAILFVAGMPWRYIFITLGLCFAGLAILISVRPYVLERVETFLNPTHDVLGSSYQINQSMNAIGSGGFWGRGWGKSVQKFTHLPEPHGDSIFAVIAEEVGFVGVTVLIVGYMLFLLRGIRISVRAPDETTRLMVIGLVVLVASQAFLNIAALSGLLPLTGVPLPFISHGGTSLAFTLGAMGIVLHISTQTRSLVQRK